MLIKKIDDGKFIIQSCQNGRNMQVQSHGRCVFANNNELLWEQFDIEAVGDGRFFFISCHTVLVKSLIVMRKVMYGV